MVNKLIDGVSFLKSKFQTDELDEKLNQAVSEENWQASTQLLHEIANAAYNHEKEQRILAFLWEKLKHKSWKKVLKALHLTDFLLKYGPTTLVSALKENIYEFRNFDNYTLVLDGIDRGESIRKQSRAVVGLLSDDHYLSDERVKAKQIKDRMANVIGSSVYYGSFSNDGSNMPTSAPKKESTYQSYSASSYNRSMGGGTIGGGSSGMSFGESVMRSLQQAKKQEETMIPTSTVPEEKPKLNLSKMNINERKPEEKKNFNSLSMKLVKPPEKKPTEKKPEPSVISPQKAAQKPQGKQGKVDIMDIDFLSGSPEPKQEQTVNYSSSSDVFDFLSGPSTVTNNPPPQLPVQPVQQSYSNGLNFGLLGTNPNPVHPTQNISFQPASQQQAVNSNFLFTGSTATPSYNYQQPPLQTTTAPAFSFTQQPSQKRPPPLPAQNISISLNTPSQLKSTSTSSMDLIDFSNFREQLSRSGPQEEKKSIVEQWNW